MENSIQKKLHALFVAYSKNLPLKINQINKLWLELKQNPDIEKLEIFHREVHSLCGSSGTYGYPRLSQAARQLEVFLKSIIARGKLDNVEAEKIDELLSHIGLVLSEETPNTLSVALHDNEAENKCIYILESDAELSQQLFKELKDSGYSPFLLPDLQILEVAIKERVPTAIIINTYYLEKSGLKTILDIQKDLPNPFHVFCILSNGELLPRLLAVRAGSDALFQKPVDTEYLIQTLNLKCSLSPAEPYRILIVDDSRSIANYYTLILNQAGMTAKALTNPLEIFSELESFQPTLLLMDVYMPDCNGFELAEVLRQESSYAQIPIIFLSTEDDKEKKLFAISLGGDDFLTKPVAPQHLVSTVRSRSKRASVLNYYMTTDSLTGLLNHSSILKQLELHILQAKKTDSCGSFIMVDIDYFKKINDTYGHPIGDVVIKRLAQLFLAKVRSQGCVGRYGGEEFALILPGEAINQSRLTANELRTQFSSFRFKANHREFYATFSAGISYFDSESKASMIIAQADQALYTAKQMGRDQIAIYPN